MAAGQDSNFMQGDYNNGVTVPFSDDDTAKPANDNAADDEDSPDASPEERKTRAQRRTERINRLLSEGKANAERVKLLEERDQRRERELAELRGAVTSTQTHLASQQQPGKDPYEQRLDAVYQKQSEAYNTAQAEIKAGTFTAERQQHYERIAREIETEKTKIHTERVIDSRQGQQRAESAQAVWVQKYPEVYNNQKALQYATASWHRKMALLRSDESPTNAMVEEIMAETINQFKLGSKPAPTQTDRTRMSGIPSAGGGGGKSSSGGVNMTPEFRRMARAAYPDLSDVEAEKKWVNTTGKRLRERKVL